MTPRPLAKTAGAGDAQVTRSRIGVATYLAPPGSLNDEPALQGLREAFNASLAAREIHLVVDLGNVNLVNSAALELLLDTHHQVARFGGEIRVTNANAVVTEVLEITEIADLVAFADVSAETPHRPVARPVRPGRLGDRLVEQGLVSEAAVRQAVALQGRTGRRLGHILVEEGLVSERDLLRVLSEQLGLPFVRLRVGLYDPETVRLLPGEVAKRLAVVPLFHVRGTVFLATADPQAMPSLDTVEDLTGLKVRSVLATRAEINATISDARGDDHDLSEYIGELDGDGDFRVIESESAQDSVTIDEIASGSPVINLINGLIQRAVREGVSDIHIEPLRNRSQVRFRIDGVLYPAMSPPADVHPAVVSRLKVMANLDIAERRLPQDGRIQVYTHGRTVDLRFSSLPGIYGEKVVLRVLDKPESVFDIAKLGMNEAHMATFQDLLHRSHGLVLATGPTGSGKTTTLYAALSHLNSSEKSIVTIEDPVEYQLDLINQNQVKPAVGLDFATMLKHILRQDPDIVMVGEIREHETAEIAVQAALTGHLVLSTLHTNDSAGAITRLLDMGVQPFLLSSALIGVLAQRLVRTVCPSCKTEYVAPPGALTRFGIDQKRTVRLVRGRGCPACYDSGYKGRIAIYELLEPDGETQRLMLSGPTREVLAEHVRARGIRTLLDDGMQRVLDGQTTVEEVTRVVSI